MSALPDSDLVLRNMFSCLVMAESLPSDELRLAAVVESIELPAVAAPDLRFMEDPLLATRSPPLPEELLRGKNPLHQGYMVVPMDKWFPINDLRSS